MLIYTKNNYIFNYSEATRASIKYQFMPLNRKFSQLFNGITCHLVSLKKKMLQAKSYNERNFFFGKFVYDSFSQISV